MIFLAVLVTSTTTEASFVISRNIARAKRPYSDSEFVKKNIAEVVAVLDPNNTKLQRLIAQAPASRHTTDSHLPDHCQDGDSQDLY